MSYHQIYFNRHNHEINLDNFMKITDTHITYNQSLAITPNVKIPYF
jgi:hypothetical protein